MTDKKDKGGVHSFFNKLTRLKMIPDRDIPMALLFWLVKGSVYIRKFPFFTFFVFKISSTYVKNATIRSFG